MVGLFVSVFLGIGLSAAAGFRVFLPLFGVSLATYMGWWTAPPDMLWAGSLPALVLFGTACVVELAAYYIPIIDHLLDTIAAPSAVVAGTVLTACALSHNEISPIVQWAAALIVGGTTAGLVSGGTAAVRVGSTALTGGLGNPVVSTVEVGSSLLLTVLAIIVPVFTGVAVLVLLFFAANLLRQRWLRWRKPTVPTDELAEL